MFRDNIPAIVLNQWETTADYLDDDLLDGVMLVLFAYDVRAAEAAISEAPLTAKRDLERLAKIYFVPETLDLTQAEAIVRKPRLGEVIFWFKNLNLERLFAEDRLAAAYNVRNRAVLQEASAVSSGRAEHSSAGASGGKKSCYMQNQKSYLSRMVINENLRINDVKLLMSFIKDLRATLLPDLNPEQVFYLWPLNLVSQGHI